MAAHLFRGQHYLLVALAALMPTLLLIPRFWVARVMQLGLVLSAAEWLRTMAMLMQERIALGQPYVRMGLILGGVAIFTIGSAFTFYSAALCKRYMQIKSGRLNKSKNGTATPPPDDIIQPKIERANIKP
jgi:hypothetical protein